MFFEETIFLVPIYRQTREKYFEELKDDFKKYESDIAQTIDDKEYLKKYYSKEESEKRYGRYVKWEGNSIWEINQIIGYIQFYLHGIIIKANLWFINAKRINKRPKRKTIEYVGKLGDVTDIEYSDNIKIRADILKFIEDVQQGLYGYKFLKQHYISNDLLLKIINHLDIKSIVESNIKS